MLSPSTPQHLSSPFLLQKNRDKREESQPEKAFKSKSNFKCFPLLGKNFFGGGFVPSMESDVWVSLESKDVGCSGCSGVQV